MPSRKRSAASSTARRLESAAFYLDQSIFSHVLADGIRQAGAQVRRPGVDVPYDTPDAEWLATAGGQGWIVLMRDQRVRYRETELQALSQAGVAAFVVAAGQATAQQVTDTVLRRLKTLVSLSVSERRPFLYTLTLSGTLTRIALRTR